MQKLIRILAIGAAALIATSLFLLIATIPFQRSIGEFLYGASDEVLSGLPQIPLLPLLYGFLRLGCVVPLIFCCGNKKGGIWLEIVAFAALCVVIPLLSFFLSPLYAMLIARFQGAASVMAYTTVENIANFCMIPAGLGQSLAYAVCGMSIVFKRMSKKAEVPPAE